MSEFDNIVNSTAEAAEIRGHAKGHAEGRAEGRAEGACQVRTDVAEKLLLKGMSITDIAEVTGMTAEEIRCLQK